jgi:PHS family inorganic phosphate transporter-like MFS transporter
MTHVGEKFALGTAPCLGRFLGVAHGRTTGHGIAASMGKIGGFVGVFTFPFFMHWHGLMAAEGTAAIVSCLGLIVTIFLLPETKGKSLEELSDEPATPVEKAAA